MGYMPAIRPIFWNNRLSGSGSPIPSFSAAASDSLASSTIFRILSSIQFAPWLVSSIVRFWGIIAGRVRRVLLRELRFVLLGLGMVREFVGLTGLVIPLVALEEFPGVRRIGSCLWFASGLRGAEEQRQEQRQGWRWWFPTLPQNRGRMGHPLLRLGRAV